jgi:hypothetical protein
MRSSGHMLVLGGGTLPQLTATAEEAQASQGCVCVIACHWGNGVVLHQRT